MRQITLLITGGLFISSLYFSCSKISTDRQSKPLHEWVNPFIGTGGHGHTYPGAVAPFGLVQLSPDTRLEGWDGCSGYHYSDSLIYGFSHTHLSGTGIADLCDVLLMPFVGETNFNNGADGKPGYRSAFKKSSEKAHAGYYSVHLDQPDVDVELTATERAGFHKYRFKKSKTASVILDLVHRDEVLDASLKKVSATELEGHRFSRSWAQNQKLFFVIQFSEPIQNFEIENLTNQAVSADFIADKKIRAAYHFDLSKSEQLLIKVGISAVDIAGARRNLEAEIPDWDFEKIRQETETKWDRQLGKIEVETLTDDDKTIFYTALYHTNVVPSIFSDTDGRYRGLDDSIHLGSNRDQYTVFSIWDTYRAAHPLYTILEQKRTADFIQTFLSHYDEGGRLPIWELWGNETNCMIGYHAVSVIADAYLKGIQNFEAEKALKAMEAFAKTNEFGKKPYGEKGFISSEDEAESVSKTLEYAYNDWCIAQMAHALGKDSLYKEFTHRSQNWKNLFDPATHFFRPKNRHFWVSPFDPFEVNFHFTEANSWQYAFYVPHDLEDFSAFHDGKQGLEKMLDSLFAAHSKTTGREQSDITGLIGQYAHGNEPSHHMAHLYNFVNRPSKTQFAVHQILTTQYRNAPDGLSGNEDCGQMSAWYVLNALGFYALNPGQAEYSIGTPRVKSAKIHLENGKVFEIKSANLSEKNFYIESFSLDGVPQVFPKISHESLMNGGVLEFKMGPNPSKNWEKDLSEIQIKRAPLSYRVVPVPAISQGKKVFFDSDTFRLNHPLPGAEIFYALDGAKFQKFEKPFVLQNSAAISVYAKTDFGESRPIETQVFKIPEKRFLTLGSKYAPQYSAGGDNALIDFVFGGRDFRTGEWQGYEGVDLEAVVDLGKIETVKKVEINFLQDENAWIFMPIAVKFSGSDDGKEFTPITSNKNNISPKEKGAIIKTFSAVPKRSFRYLKVIGFNMGTCPAYHKGAGGKSWIFADEITIR